MNVSPSKLPKDSAGRLLTTKVPTIPISWTAEQAESYIRKNANQCDSINYLYLVNPQGVLVGVVSLKELLRLDSTTNLGACTKRPLVTARLHTDQERVAHLALAHNLKAIPLVTKDHEFLGVVPSDAILDVLNREHTEDVLRFAGVRSAVDNQSFLLAASPFSHVRERLPWLVLGLLGGLAAAFVVDTFEHMLTTYLILAAFIPAIVYLADAVGSQTQMLLVRTLTLRPDMKLAGYLWRELVVNIILATFLAALIGIISYFWLHLIDLSVTLSLAIFFTITCTVVISVGMPWFIHKIGYDPAVASGPVATVIRDMASLLIYFAVASILLA